MALSMISRGRTTSRFLGRVVEDAVGLLPEACTHPPGEPARFVQPAGLERDLVQGERRVAERGPVLEEGGDPGFAVGPDVQQPWLIVTGPASLDLVSARTAHLAIRARAAST